MEDRHVRQISAAIKSAGGSIAFAILWALCMLAV